MNVVICTPVYAGTTWQYSLSLAEMIVWTLTQEIIYNGKKVTPGISVRVEPSTRVDLAREALAEWALQGPVDYLLWLDADHSFPRDTMLRLMAHDKPIVGANYRHRRLPDEARSTAANIVDGQTVSIASRAEGVEAVDVVGLGVCLTKAEVFRALPKPWFEMGRFGEDASFCLKAKAHGFQPCVDHALSGEVGHVAETVLHF